MRNFLASFPFRSVSPAPQRSFQRQQRGYCVAVLVAGGGIALLLLTLAAHLVAHLFHL